jgi:hypothetical protein
LWWRIIDLIEEKLKRIDNYGKTYEKYKFN